MGGEAIDQRAQRDAEQLGGAGAGTAAPAGIAAPAGRIGAVVLAAPPTLVICAGRSTGAISSPLDSTAARSITLRSSRTLPGQA